MTAARYERQAGLLPPDTLHDLPIAVAGVGAVGRQVVLQLASAGARNITFYDHDEVEEVNMGPQGWREEDIGRRKVDALFEELMWHHAGDDNHFTPLAQRYPLGGLHEHVLFCCVDGIETRERIFTACKGSCPLFIDSRVVSDTIHILACCESAEWDYYPSTIFDAAEAFRGSCTTKMSIHTASIAGGLLVQQLSKWLRGMPQDRHTVFNFLAMEAYSK